MEKLSFYLFWAALITLGFALLFHLVTLVRRHRGTSTLNGMFTWLGVVFLAGALVTRWFATGHAPYSNMYEYSMSFALGTTVAYAVMDRKYSLGNLGAIVLPVVIALIAYAMTLSSAIEPLVPALQNQELLTIHVAMAVISYGVFTVAFGAAVLQLTQGPQNRFAFLPTWETLDEVSFRAVVVGFPFFALLLILGAYWGNIAWGRYWAWDPKETSALVTWLIYAAYLHTRNLAGWRGSRSAILLIVGFAAVLFTYFAINLWIVGLHSYAGV
ncbi:MAG: c-type cytochrome biogenesis protein CcsB [Dehalococcoidia bacterium]|nr:c-type cytochrome biogenesis protein CcsB [Dehalococcoidia bacterium]